MKVLGSWAREDIISAIDAASIAVMTRGLNMTMEEVTKVMDLAKEDLRSNKVHMYMAV
jgi:hypothetical protein